MKIKELTNEAGILKGIGQALAPNAMRKVDKEIPTQTGSRDFEHKGESYRWLGNKWGVKVGAGRYEPAPEEMQQELNDLASGDVNAPGPSDINATLDSNTQYRFPHPLFRADDIDIIVRRDGWYLSKLPKSLRGRVQRDKETRLYRVKQPRNIQKFNDYYDKAADSQQLIVEPTDSL